MKNERKYKKYVKYFNFFNLVYLLSGGLCGECVDLVLYPLDTIKTYY